LMEDEINKNLQGSVKSYRIICVDGTKIKAENELEKFQKELTTELKGV